MLQTFVSWSRNINPILQGAIGSAIFALLLAIGRLLYRVASAAFRQWRRKRELNEITRIVIHKYYVNRNGLYYFSLGYLFVLMTALRPFIQGVLVFITSFGVAQIFPAGDVRWIVLYVGTYAAIQLLINSLAWLNPKLSSRSLDAYDQELVKAAINRLVEEPEKELHPPERAKSRSQGKSSTATRNKLDEIHQKLYSSQKRGRNQN